MLREVTGLKRILSILLIGVLLLSAAACKQTVSNNDASADVMTDEDLVDRTFYLLDGFVLPFSWYRGGDGSDLLNVNDSEGVEPLENTPEGTAFYQVLRFNSIKELKRATEQVVTKEYAEKYLYPDLVEYNLFLERDGKLYLNTEIGAGGTPFGPVEATVLSKTEDEAMLSVVFRDTLGEEEVHEIELKRENGIWKLNNYPYWP